MSYWRKERIRQLSMITDSRSCTTLHAKIMTFCWSCCKKEAVKKPWLNICRRNRKNFEQLIERKDRAGETCLHYAVMPFKQDIQGSIDESMEDPQYEYIRACRSHQPSRSYGEVTLSEIVKKMSELDCVDLQSSSGETPLLLSCRITDSNRKSVIETLINDGKACPDIAVSFWEKARCILH